MARHLKGQPLNCVSYQLLKHVIVKLILRDNLSFYWDLLNNFDINLNFIASIHSVVKL